MSRRVALCGPIRSKTDLIERIVTLSPRASIDRTAAQPQCLHGPNEDAARKNASDIRAARRPGDQYRRSERGLAKDGFESDFTTDGKTYALILYDKMDACGFAFSTNQKGVIFQGYPINYDVQPISR